MSILPPHTPVTYAIGNRSHVGIVYESTVIINGKRVTRSHVYPYTWQESARKQHEIAKRIHAERLAEDAVCKIAWRKKHDRIAIIPLRGPVYYTNTRWNGSPVYALAGILRTPSLRTTVCGLRPHDPPRNTGLMDVDELMMCFDEKNM